MGHSKKRILAPIATLVVLLAATGPLFAAGPSTMPASGADFPDDASATSGAESPELMMFKDIPVVVAAGKREQTTLQAAASVSVVTADDIQLFGYRSLADVLRAQRSFYLQTDGLNWFAGVRGFLRPGEWNARLLVLVDGRPTHELIYGQTHLDQDFVVPMEAVKRVEIIRGPGSSLYGSNAVFGVINVVTKDGADVHGVEAKVEGGTKETGRASILFGDKFKNGWDVIGEFTGYHSSGDKDIIYDGVTDAAHNYGHIRNFDDEDVYSGFLKAKSNELTLTADVEDRAKGNRAATYITSFMDPGSMYEKRLNLTAKVDHEINQSQSIHGMVYYGHYSYDQSWQYAPAPPVPQYGYTSTGTDDYIGEEIHYDWQMTRSFHLLAGADATQSIQTRQMDTDTLQGTVLDVPASTNTFGVFAEGEQKVTDWLTLTVGGRVDHTQRIGTTISPRAAAIFNPTKEDAIKLLYGRAHRDPNLYEMLYAEPNVNAPNPQLKPEIVDTYEVAWERQYRSGWATTLDGFLWKMSDAMDNQTLASGAIQTQNVGSLWAHGVEGEIGKKWDSGGSFRMYASYTRAQDDNGSGLTHSPSWIVGSSTAIPVINNRSYLSIEPQFVGAMKDDLGNTIGATFITNVVFTSRDIYKGWTFQAGLYNLFGNYARMPRDGAFNQYQTSLNYPNPELLVSLSYRF